jgi:alanine racemase
LKINLSIEAFADTIGANLENENHSIIQLIAFDSRKISNPSNTAFFAFQGEFRNGHDFIQDAYSKGIQTFVVDKKFNTSGFPNATFLFVEDPLIALQKLAKFHRLKFNYPIVAITGSVGKTIVKEWIYHLISGEKKVIRSPKSYNSQIGVALSLLALDETADLAIIEAGISKPGEMQLLKQMIEPTIGIFTAFGSAHRTNFESPEQHLNEKLALFENTNPTFIHESIQLQKIVLEKVHGQMVENQNFNAFLKHSPFQDKASLDNLALCIAFALEIGISKNTISDRIKDLPRLALRMETFDGINENLIINDTYNLDLDALSQSLEFQLSIANGKKRVAILAADSLNENQKIEIQNTLEKFKLDEVFFISNENLPSFDKIQHSVVLIKGTRASQLQKIARLFQLKKHKTRVEIDFSAVKNNLNYFRSLTKIGTKMLVMVKASSYGSGAEKMAEFLEKSGVEYLGVAYADEGVELRKHGIKLPILVMNAEEEGFNDIIQYNLEPAIFSYKMMDDFVKALIMENIEEYPVHLKFDTGMRRLGFAPSEVEKVVELFQSQPEIKLQSVYSHLADSDNLLDASYSLEQITIFNKICNHLSQKLNYPFDRHLLNTEGIARFPDADYEMVRLGIGIYGYSVNSAVQKELQPAIAWKSMVSQIKTIQPGESVGYSRKFVASKITKIGVIPVGYADGFRRSLGTGKGGFVIQGKWCPVVGSVCMDMTMVDITDVDTFEGDEVEIIGKTQTLNKLANAMETIPYEVLTSISKRVHRIYLEH